MAGGRLTKKESDTKKRQGKRMFINGFSRQEISEILEVHIETVKRWHKKEEWQKEKDVHSLSVSELKRETLQTFADMKEGKTPKLSPDQLSKLASTFDKLSDKKKALAYMYENYELLSDAILKDALSERSKAKKESKLETAKYVREMMEALTSKTYKEALND
jgi:transposase